MTNGSLNNYRFSFWLPLFAFLLLLIPISIGLDLIALAKITGVVVLVLLLVALRQWFAQARLNNHRLERVALTTNDLFLLKKMLPAFQQMSVSDQRILCDQLGLFLAEAQFKGEWSTQAKFSVGILAVLSTWEQGYTSKLTWVFVSNAPATYFMEPNPSKSFLQNQGFFDAKDLKALLTLDVVSEFNKGVQASF